MGRRSKKMKRVEPEPDLSLFGSPIPAAEATEKWPLRYKHSKSRKLGTAETTQTNGDSGQGQEIPQAQRHYRQAMIGGFLFNPGDDAYVNNILVACLVMLLILQAEEGNPDCISKIIELVEGIDGEPYFRAQWFYRAEDTVIKSHAYLLQEKRVVLSDIKDGNPLNCIVSRVKIVKVPPKMASETEERVMPPCDLYYDMKFEMPHLTFSSIDTENFNGAETDTSSTVSSESDSNCISSSSKDAKFLLDLCSGCGAMSTGLCMGASLSGVKLVTKWAVDINSYACESLKLNRPKAEARNKAAEDFLSLLKQWKRLRQKFSLIASSEPKESDDDSEGEEEDEEEDKEGDDGGFEVSPGEFEVGDLLTICYGDPNEINKSGLYFKVRWKGYGPEEDTWEP